MKKIACILITFLLICGILTSCYDLREIDEMAYAVAIGLDKGKTNMLKLTIQIAVPIAIAGEGGGGGNGGGSGEGGKGSDGVVTTTVEVPGIFAGLDLINSYISKELSLSHAKLIIFSEELAREGIDKYMHEIMREREFRTNMFVAVSHGSAENYLRSVSFLLELNPSKFYEMDFSTYRYTGFTVNSQFFDFYVQKECSCRQAVATLVGINQYQSSDEFDLEKSTFREKGRDIPLPGDYRAGELPKIYDVKTEIMGAAVFDGDKMVGELDGRETASYLILSGKLKSLSLTIPDPLKENFFIELGITNRRKPIHKVKMVGDRPNITAKVLIEADIISIQSGVNYEQDGNRDILEDAVEKDIKRALEWYLEKTKALKTDITGFGRKIKSSLLFWDDWEDFNWLGKYEKSTFDVDADVKIRRTGSMVRSNPSWSTGGKEMN